MIFPPTVIGASRCKASRLFDFLFERMSKLLGDQFDQHLAHKARFARAGDAGDGSEHAQRKLRVELVQVVARHAAQSQPARRRSRSALRWRAADRKDSAAFAIAQPLPALRGPAVEHFAAMHAGSRADIHNPVRAPHHVEIVLDHEQRIARLLQPVERAQQSFGIGGMQSGGRLIEHIHHAEEVGSHLGCQAKALQLSRRKCRRAAFQREVAESEIEQHREPSAEVVRDPLHDLGFFRMLVRELCRGSVPPGPRTDAGSRPAAPA